MFNIYIEPKSDEGKLKQIHLKLRVSPGGYVEMCAVDENGEFLVPLWQFSKLDGKIITYCNTRLNLLKNKYDTSGIEFDEHGCICLN